MAIKLENGDVKIGDSIINSKNGKIGVFESLYELNINIRYLDDNSLETIPILQCSKTTNDALVNSLKEKSREELLAKLAQLSEALEEYNITVRTIDKTKENKGVSKLETPAILKEESKESFLDKTLKELNESRLQKELENGDKKAV